MNKKTISLRNKIAIPLVILIILQNVIFLSGIWITQVFEKLDNEAYRVLHDQVQSRSEQLSKSLSEFTLYIENFATNLNQKLNILDYKGNIVEEISGDIIDLVQTDSITGAFFIDSTSNDNSLHDGLYIRDLSPRVMPKNNSDLLVERGSKKLCNKLNIALDTQWSPKFNFSNEYKQKNVYFDDSFYFKPYTAAMKHPNESIFNLGYWSKPFKLSSNDENFITYSVPIFDANKKILGVLGAEIMVSTVSKLMPSNEILYTDGFYLIGEMNGDKISDKWFIPTDNVSEEILKKEIQNVKINSVDDSMGDEMIASIIYLDIYSKSTIYTDKWVLAGIVEKSLLQKSSNDLESALIMSLIISFIVGLISIIFLGYYITKPIEKLAEETKKIDPDVQTTFNRTNITELDYLITALEKLNSNIADSSSRMSKIVDIIGLPIGCFEEDFDKKRVFLTDNLFDMLGIEKESTSQKFIDLVQWENIRENLLQNVDENQLNCYKLENNNNTTKWLTMKFINEKEKTLGIIIDVSDDVMKKQALEYERDHDVLTQLLNRKAFVEKAEKLIDSKPDKIGALVFCDLDNLKRVNDTYGHNYGDKYIKAAADLFNIFSLYNALVARISGDEFAIFIYGYDDESEIHQIIDYVFKQTENSAIDLPDGNRQKISSSKGISWYPRNSKSIVELVKYADFAMYQVKKSTKNGIKEFDPKTYTI